jgi:hypothetical protein
MPWARILPEPMAARLPVRRQLVIVALAITASVGWPAVTRGVEAIPPDQTGDALAGATVGAIVGDVDGDGIRDLVRLRASDADRAGLAVEVISVSNDGALQIHGEAPLLREEAFGAQGLVLTRINEPARLLAWRLDGAERVLAVATGGPQAGPCCLTIWQVALDDDATALHRVGGRVDYAEQILAVDMDADGTDELILTSFGTIAVLRWSGDQFDVVDRSWWPGRAVSLVPLGESDGVPGDEAGSILSPSNAGGTVLLARVALDPAGRLRMELADLPFFGGLAPVTGPDGGRLVIGSNSNGAALLRWPAGAARIEIVATSLRRGMPLAVLGAGVDARLLLLRDGGIVDVLGPDLRPNRLGIAGGVAAGSFERTESLPYVGQLPGGLLDGEAAFIFNGRMVTGVVADDGRPRLGEREIAALPGVTPIGVFGAGGARIGLAVPNRLVSAAAAFDASRDGGQMTEPTGPSTGIELVAADTNMVLTAEADGGKLEVPIRGAVVQERGSRQTVLARGEFMADVRGPAESWVLVHAGKHTSAAQIDGSGAIWVPIGPAEAKADAAFSAGLVVLTPSGHGYHVDWDVRIRLSPPKVQVSAPLAPLSFAVPVSGRTDPGARVSIDGEEVAVGPDGSFVAEVLAGPLPRDVRIEVTDPVGNSASRALSVVGILDYRRLPWIPMVALLTVLTGALLYFRAPRPVPVPVRRAGDDAQLEEIE